MYCICVIQNILPWQSLSEAMGGVGNINYLLILAQQLNACQRLLNSCCRGVELLEGIMFNTILIPTTDNPGFRDQCATVDRRISVWCGKMWVIWKR